MGARGESRRRSRCPSREIELASRPAAARVLARVRVRSSRGKRETSRRWVHRDANTSRKTRQQTANGRIRPARRERRTCARYWPFSRVRARAHHGNSLHRHVVVHRGVIELPANSGRISPGLLPRVKANASSRRRLEGKDSLSCPYSRRRNRGLGSPPRRHKDTMEACAAARALCCGSRPPCGRCGRFSHSDYSHLPPSRSSLYS